MDNTLALDSYERPSLALATSICVPIFLSLCLLYAAIAPHLDTEKKRAYILSVTSSAIMTIVSIPFFALYVSRGLEEMYERSQHGILRTLGLFGVCYFGTYLFADLAIGYVKYSSQVGLLTGWIHHSVYIGIMIYCYQSPEYPIFLAAGVMEVPTFDLGISTLLPHVRNDLRFLISFLVLRILYNFGFLIDACLPSRSHLFLHAPMPPTMLALALALHVMWFKGGVTGYLKRRAKARVLTQSQPAVTQTPIPPSLSPSTPGLATPEDSPLVTPFTSTDIGDSHSRDSFFFPQMPQMPHLPNLPKVPNFTQLPTVAIPNLPSLSELTAALNTHRENLNFGFRDAVRSRIVEQRGRFADFTSGTMALDFSGLKLRRITLSQKESKNLNDEEGDTQITVAEVQVEE